MNLLDSLSAASRCDAINFLLQTLKCKYPDACDRVVRSLFSHKPNDNNDHKQDELAKCKQLQQLQLKKEKLEPGREAEIKRECPDRDEENTPAAAATASTIDLNQNFEKILCKEEFMCLDQEEEDILHDDDADDTENSSSMSKQRLHFHHRSTNSSTAKANASRSRSNNNNNAVGVAPLLNSDPLLIKRKYAATFDDDEELLMEDDDELDGDVGDDDSNSNSCEELLLLRRRRGAAPGDGSELLVKRKRTNNFIGELDTASSTTAVTVTLPVTRTSCSRLGEGYVFHEDNQYTLRYHHSSGEFSERAFKAQFRLLLRLALSQHHKPFLKQFYDNFVCTGRLLGTTPSARVLKELREQRLDEWRRQRERRQLAKAAAEEAAAAALELEQQLLKEKEQQQLQREQLRQQQQQELQQQRQQEAEQLRQAQQEEAEQQLEELSEPMDQQLELPMPLESQEPRQLRSISFGDSELESETESQLSSTAQGIMKFEEFIDEDLGAGRLIDGLEMEPEIDEMLAGAGGGSGSGLGSVTGTGSGNSSNSNSSVAVHDNGIASLLLQDTSSRHQL